MKIQSLIFGEFSQFPEPSLIVHRVYFRAKDQGRLRQNQRIEFL